MNMNNHEYGYMAIGVDIQNDFCPGGSLAVPDGNKVVAPFNVLAHQTRKSGGTVIFTRDWHPAQTNHFDAWPPHCIANTHGADFHPGLAVHDNDIIVSKGTLVDEDAYSGFQGVAKDGTKIQTLITEKLKHHHRLLIAVGGLATDYCVKATVLDALKLNETLGENRLTIIALRGCMRAVNINPDDGLKALQTMKAQGALFELPEGTLL